MSDKAVTMLEFSGKKTIVYAKDLWKNSYDLNVLNLIFMIMVSLVDSFYIRHPHVILIYLLIESAVIVYRRYISKFVLRFVKFETRNETHYFVSGMYWAAWLWSSFTVTTLFLFGLEPPGCMVIVVSGFLLAISQGSVRNLKHICIILMAPIAIWGGFLQTKNGYILCGLLFLQIYMFIHRNSAKTIDGISETFDNQRTSELVKINKELQSEILYRKNMEKALRRSEERYRTLFQNNPIETIIVDYNGRITGYNSAKARSLGRVPEIGDVMYKDYGSRHVNDMFDELMDCINTGRQKEFPEQKYNERYLHIRISPYSGGAIITSLDITKTKRAEEQIQTLTRELMRVQENERKRIARDLHDSVAQDLSSLRISCETFFDDNPESSLPVRHKISEISRVLHGSINAVRDIAYELRPPCLDELGLPITLYRYCEDFTERTGINVDFFSAGLEQFRMDPDSEINLYRLVQEALNNIRKHSCAKKASIRLVASFPHVILRIDDNGVGFEADLQSTMGLPNKHMGLRSMEERVNLLGGRIRLKSRPGFGTSVFVEVPIYKTAQGDVVHPSEKMVNH